MAVRALARVNLAAIERNVARLAAAAPTAVLCAVVKADGYGHGAVATARAARRGGAKWLAVATAREAAALRAAAIEQPILVLGALSAEELPIALEARADVVVWSEQALAAIAALGGGRVHIKFDSGMGRLGTRDGELATRLVRLAAEDSRIEAVGLMTHFATADERGDEFFSEQLERFDRWSNEALAIAPGLLRHAANSAALLRDERSHFDLVRPGIACYGLDPFGLDAAAQSLEAALTLESYVAAINACAVGQSTGYGRSFVATEPTTLATVPVGYADGWKRVLSNNTEVLIAGHRYPLVGNISMDNFSIDLGAGGGGVTVGDRVTLIGADQGEQISAEELAGRASTINYEVVTSIGARVERRYQRDGEDATDEC